MSIIIAFATMIGWRMRWELLEFFFFREENIKHAEK
jgi:hypothetical protein